MKKSIIQQIASSVLTTALLLAGAAEARNLKVNCNKAGGGEFRSINAAIAYVARHPTVGTNTITVTGACNENVSIVFLDNVTLQAGPEGASITDASGGTQDTLVVLGSCQFAMFNFTINGSMSCTNDAVCRTYNNVFQNGSPLGYGIRYSRSHGDTDADIIQNVPGDGISVQNASRVAVGDTTIQQNGGNGIHVGTAGYLILLGQVSTTTIRNNGNNGVLVTDHSTVRLEIANVTGNANDGIRLLSNSVLRMEYAAPTVNNVTGNGGAGVHVSDQSFAFFPDDGSANVTGNLGGTDVVCSGQFPATRGALTNIDGGTTNCNESVPPLRSSPSTLRGNSDMRSPQ